MRRITILFVCLFVFAAAVTSSQSTPKYQIIDLGVLPGYTISEALGINDSGTVVGICINDQATTLQGFIWTREAGIQPVAVPPGDEFARPNDINNDGYIAGWSRSLQGHPNAVLWSPDGSVKVIQENCDARAINDRGQVSGQTSWGACMWDADGTWINIGRFEGHNWGYGEDINNSGTVTGYSMGHRLVSLPFIWSASKGMLPLSMPEGATSAYPIAINDAGDVVGFIRETTAGYAFCWKADGSTAILAANNLFSSAEDINNSGQITGYIGTEPVLWNPDGTVVKLGTLAGTEGRGYAINNKGWVAGYSYGSDERQHAVIWLPSSRKVKIDIKPGDDTNVINLKSKGMTPAAILGDKDFDAATVDPTTVVLAGASVKSNTNGKPMASCEDVNGDGCMDMLLHFPTQSLNLAPADTKAGLEGKTVDGLEFEGEDSVTVR